MLWIFVRRAEEKQDGRVKGVSRWLAHREKRKERYNWNSDSMPSSTNRRAVLNTLACALVVGCKSYIVEAPVHKVLYCTSAKLCEHHPIPQCRRPGKMHWRLQALKHIAKALQTRSKAICNALNEYNAAAKRLSLPGQQLCWDEVVDSSTVFVRI